MTEQTTALRLADALEDGTYLLSVERNATAAELRKMHDLLGKSRALNRIRAERIKELEKALGLAVEALEYAQPFDGANGTVREAIAALRERLGREEQPNRGNVVHVTREQLAELFPPPARQEQEQVAWIAGNGTIVHSTTHPHLYTPLYTAPQPSQQPLTDEEICRIGAQVHGFLLCNEGQWGIEMARAVEAAHGITGKKK